MDKEKEGKIALIFQKYVFCYILFRIFAAEGKIVHP